MSAASAPQTVAPAAIVVSAPSADYLAAVMAALERQKRYPEIARRRQEQGTVLIDFAIDRVGRVLSARIRRGSGSALLDSAAEAMVHQADPLPAPPASYAAARLELVLPVTFSLQ
ncbi:MAG TPA: TonB family protein [Candidatus Sulfotelmatobacter sp.]|nr:TonB family protein [Candidatus Sulfotelmatobacter sp.]